MPTQDDTRLPSGQIPLPFDRYAQLDFATYRTQANHEAVASLKQLAAGAENRNHYLWGQSGTGKSHLLQAACTRAAAADRSAAYIPLRLSQSLSPALLTGLATLDLVCIDDLDAILDQARWEQALFVLFNEMRECRKPLLFSADRSPKGLAIAMPDLKSRLAWDLVFHLAPMDETSLIQALQERAHTRMFDLPGEVVEFLVKRVSRDPHTLFDILDQLDTASLQSQKKLTVPFVKSILDLS